MGSARLRLWPGVIIVVLLWLARLAAPAVMPGPLEELFVRGVSSLVGALAVAIWWLFFSRAARRERWAVAGVMVAAGAVTLLIGHESIGVFWLVMYALPVLCLDAGRFGSGRQQACRSAAPCGDGRQPS